MSRLERYLILTAVVVVCGIAGLWAQNAGPVRTVAEETLHVDASSATVLQWFRKIEREKHIVLSYNASLIDLSRVRKVNTSGLLKTVDIRSPKTVISVHFSYSLPMAMQIY